MHLSLSSPVTDRTRRGFSLVEISLALLVVSIGMLALVGLFPVSLNMSKQAVDETYASFLADSAFASYKGAALYVPWDELQDYQPIAPNTISQGQDVFWANSEQLRLRADDAIHTLVFQVSNASEKWRNGSSPLPGAALEFDHALRYQITMQDDPNNPRIKQVIMLIWMGEFGSSDPEKAQLFYTEIFRHGA